jgi:hypothetical protein
MHKKCHFLNLHLQAVFKDLMISIIYVWRNKYTQFPTLHQTKPIPWLVPGYFITFAALLVPGATPGIKREYGENP